LYDSQFNISIRTRLISTRGSAYASSPANIDMISSIFRRPVLGIHNRSYGVVFDLIECIVQRCFSYATKDTRRTYEYLKAELTDPTATKVVVIAHSQGGIILSASLDMLFADLPSEVFEKLEVYTFGYASSIPVIKQRYNNSFFIRELHAYQVRFKVCCKSLQQPARSITHYRGPEYTFNTTSYPAHRTLLQRIRFCIAFRHPPLHAGQNFQAVRRGPLCE
jgi:hypothetical protein